ncbi:MAG: hypothetical protein AB7O38_17455 [Pirellulaceae bacterium]
MSRTKRTVVVDAQGWTLPDAAQEGFCQFEQWLEDQLLQLEKRWHVPARAVRPAPMDRPSRPSAT